MGACLPVAKLLPLGLEVQGHKEYKDPAPPFRGNSKGGTRNFRVPQRQPQRILGSTNHRRWSPPLPSPGKTGANTTGSVFFSSDYRAAV